MDIESLLRRMEDQAVTVSRASSATMARLAAEAVRSGDRKPGSGTPGGQRQLDADEIAAIQRMMREE